jgi:hypothetical protein
MLWDVGDKCGYRTDTTNPTLLDYHTPAYKCNTSPMVIGHYVAATLYDFMGGR